MTDNDKIIEPSQTPTLEGCPMPGCVGQVGIVNPHRHNRRTAREVVLWAMCDNPECGFIIRGETIESLSSRYNQLCKEVAYGQRAIAACEEPPYSKEKVKTNLDTHMQVAFNAGVNAMRDLLQPPSKVPGE